jgi:hypothetical protein
LRDFIPSAQRFDVHGLTDSSNSDFVLLPLDHSVHPDSIGRAAGGVSVRFVEDAEQLCQPGRSRELQLRTPDIRAAYRVEEALRGF